MFYKIFQKLLCILKTGSLNNLFFAWPVIDLLIIIYEKCRGYQYKTEGRWRVQIYSKKPKEEVALSTWVFKSAWLIPLMFKISLNWAKISHAKFKLYLINWNLERYLCLACFKSPFLLPQELSQPPLKRKSERVSIWVHIQEKNFISQHESTRSALNFRMTFLGKDKTSLA